MTQELIDLRNYIIDGKYEDALELIDELEGMGKQAILRNIESFLVRLVIHLIKNQLEQRLTGSWAASIIDSTIKIKSLNLKDNKTSHYIKQTEWALLIDDAIAEAIIPASNEIYNGKYAPSKLSEIVDREKITAIAQDLLDFSYTATSKQGLLKLLEDYLTELPGGEDWKFGRNR
jgi:hypothetical protein